ncbi:type III-A CRISPR-associated protein Cas10/Csm1 [Chloroflexales bacterium ZM16-3]|nr:type III-A CRISPR-associated protein Cas10/Csm1 [Chloroflexales bacterium ZM16-3]
MNQSPHADALAALRYWAEQASGASVDSPAEHVRHTAWLASGKPPEDGWPAPLKGPLDSIFNRIKKDGVDSPQAYLRPAELRLTEEALFPQAEKPVDAQASADGMLNGLRAEIDALIRRDLPDAALLEGMLFALQRYAWALPSPLPAVSLYDFARTHAALAATLADNPGGEVCLVGGDVSGVQNFLYTLTADGATKQLRGRSLYLQLLTDACAHAVLTKAGMPLCNLLYAGGGHFYALLPASALDQVAALRREIGKKLLAAHHGGLYLALGGIRFAPAAYGKDTWASMSEEIDKDKRRRFASLDSDEFAKLFTPQQPEPPKEEGAEETLGALDQSLQKLGRGLSDARFLVAEPGDPRIADEDSPCYRVLASLGLGYRTVEEERDYHAAYKRRRRLLQLDDSAVPNDLSLGRDDVLGTRYTVTEAPTASREDVAEYFRLGLDDDGQEFKQDDVLPFNLLAAYAQGVKRIGVLRMDVDNLGDLFGTKLVRPDGVAALAYTAALSAALSRFFEGWIGELCRQANENRTGGGVYAVYSGGDDLFLLGSWHLMPGLARQIRDDFARYVLGLRLEETDNPYPPITLSAGITLHGGSYPLYQAADDAAEALDTAKLFARADGHKKDAITFLGRTLGWEQFAQAEALCDELVDLVERQGAPRALLMTIQSLDTQAQANRRRSRDGTPQIAYGPWVWQGAYQLTRMAERAGGDSGQKIAQLREQIVGSEGVRDRFIEIAGLAARWAQLHIRGSRSNNEEEEQ